MSSNADSIVAQIQQDMLSLMTYVTGPETATQTAYTVELTLFRRLLALGAALLHLFFLTRAAARPAAPTAPDGSVLDYHDQRLTTYVSVFGKLRFQRHYFVAAGQAGCCPLDADLSVAALETTLREDAQDVATFYAQARRATDPAAAGAILVVQADGKAVPMVQPPLAEAPLRLGKGQKRTKKKEAIVTSLYTIAPYLRTPQDVRAALLHEERRADHPTRPAPVGKETRATLAGKAAAMQTLQQRAAQRDGGHIRAHVALSDGAESLQQHMTSTFPTYTLILDIIHASEYLWDTATTVLGESSPVRTAWVAAKLDLMLAGQTGTLISLLTQEAADPTWSAIQRQTIERTIGYYERNLAYMRYDYYLAQGWPIGTGVVEGACGHLVKDRMEQAGMRWTVDGAQAMLDLRAVRINGDWDRYWQFHRQQQHHRLYRAAPAAASPEVQALQMAA